MRRAVTDPSVHYRDIVNSLPTATLVLDADLNVQYANLAYYQMFGGSEAETLGQSMFEVQGGIWGTDELRALLTAVLPHDIAINGFTLEQTFPVIGARILNVTARRIARDGAPTQQVLIGIEDVTNHELAARAADENLHKVNAMMTEVHHRVKNNIASILSMLRIESRALDDAVAKEVLERISLRVDSMGSLYELLAIGENSGMVGLLPYFERICRSIEQMAGAHHHGWTIDVEGDDVPVTVDNAIAIGAVVNELVANAAKYAFSGRQDIGRIRVTCVEKAGELHVRVSDNGVGFDEEHVDPKSTGLGMRLVDMYLSNLGGTIERESGAQGTTCFLTIPIRDPADDLASTGDLQATRPKGGEPARAKAKSAGATGVKELLPRTSASIKIPAAPSD